MDIFSVYILLCADDSYYIGITNNVEKRVKQHNEGNDEFSYTSTRRPLRLVFARSFLSPHEAIAFEKQIKKWSRVKKKALIESNWADLKKHAACKNKTTHLNQNPYEIK